MSLTNKIDFAVVFRVRNANPNGDPLNGNRPRVTYEGIGEVSDVCIKRKIRNRLMETLPSQSVETDGKEIAVCPIFVQSDDNRLDEFATLRMRADAVLSDVKTEREKIEKACRIWFDVRAFGQLFAFTQKGKSATGSDKGVSIGIRGPVTVQSAFSITPVNVTSTQITKSVSGEGDGSKRGSDTMGMKHRIDQGMYAFFGSMNPQLARRTGFSDDDAAVIKSVLPRLFENDESSARPSGSMEVLKVVWWEHDCPSGQCSSAKVHGSLHIKGSADPDDLISFGDVDGPSPEIIDGI